MKTYPLYLNGTLQETREAVDVINPATGEAFARMSVTDRARVGRAIVDAHAAFKPWAQLPARTRGDFLSAAAREMERRGEEIARTMTMEAGKPISASRTEVAASVDHLRWFAEEGRRAYGRVIPNQMAGKRHLVIKVPVGMVGAISPWNFPLML